MYGDEFEIDDLVRVPSCDNEEGYIVGFGEIDDGCCNPFTAYAVQWVQDVGIAVFLSSEIEHVYKKPYVPPPPQPKFHACQRVKIVDRGWHDGETTNLHQVGTIIYQSDEDTYVVKFPDESFVYYRDDHLEEYTA